MKRRILGGAAVALAVSGGIGWLAMAGDCSKPSLDLSREFTSNGVNYTISYRTDAGSSHRITEAAADQLQDNALTSYDRLVSTMTFRTPYLNTIPDYEFIVKDDWWYAEPACVVLDAPSIRSYTEQESRVVFFHERFHTVQRNYKCDVADCDSGYIGSTFGKWVSEGTADSMMDKGYADIDDNAGFPFYEGSARNFLDSSSQSLFDKEYDACLWWNYLMEQMGSVTTEPQRGTDFMRAFWNRVAANGNDGSASSRAALEQEMASRGRNLKDLFTKFAICNYTREWDVSGLLNKKPYSYVDEQTLGIMTTVARTASSNTLPFSGSSSVNSYGSRYFELTVPATQRCTVIGVRATSDGGAVGFAAVGVDEGGKVVALRQEITEDFGASFFTSPSQKLTRLALVVAGHENGEAFDYSFGVGTPKVEIVRPTFAHPAYPGPAASPGNLVVRTMVTGVTGLEPEGAGTFSIMGLRAADFEVQVNSIAAPVLAANYVGGEYQLLVQAPVQVSDGLYPLTVRLCPGDDGPGATSTASVLYGDIRFHHAIAIDVSGSMDYPTSAKLDAAKEAAKFYIDAVGANDKLTVVSFSGDASECNEDATNLKGAPGLLDATTPNRNALKTAVQNLLPQNMTSIGDGLWHSQDALDVASLPTAIDTILLLTDGKENEARYWSRNDCIGMGQRVDERLTGAGTIVNTIAFGADAETTLLQEIAAETEGDYSFVPVDEGAAAGKNVVPSSSFTSMQNKLSLKFLAGLERARRLNRLALEKGSLGAGETETFDVTLTDADVASALLYVGWGQPGTIALQKVTDPDGADAIGYSVARTSQSHVILHSNKVLKAGVYRFEVRETAGKDLELFAGISGVPKVGVYFQCALSQVPTGGVSGEPESPQEGFEQGVPVDFRIAALSTKGEPLTELKGEMTVIMPDGSLACPLPFPLADDGAHSDGVADDGTYGFRFTRTPQASSVDPKDERKEKTDGTKPEQSGTYRAIITFTGKHPAGGTFSRTLEKEFQVYKRQRAWDVNQNGLPDTWETHYGLPATAKPTDDPDNDDLTNEKEFLAGSHPLDPDTDDGGECDGSEVNEGRCPLVGSDDTLPPLAEASIITTGDSHGNTGNLRPNALLLHFPDHKQYQFIAVHRSEDPNKVLLPENLVKLIDVTGKGVTSYYDEGLNDGVLYHYRLRAFAGDGACTAFTRLLSARAKADPYPPNGNIVLNNHAEHTSSTNLVVGLFGDHLAKDFRLSQSFDMGGAAWQPMAKDALFNAPVVTNGHLLVYAQFRSAAGNVSQVVDKAIRFIPGADNDGDGIPDATDPDDDNDGLSDADELNLTGTDPLDADSDDDGFSDGAEKAAGSNPLDPFSNPDADNDGVSDGLEVIYSTSPTSAASRPDFKLAVDKVVPGTRISFPTRPGVRYQLRTASALDRPASSWSKIGPVFIGDGSVKTFDVPQDQPTRFVRLHVSLAPLP